jgi:hypothetical protein
VKRRAGRKPLPPYFSGTSRGVRGPEPPLPRAEYRRDGCDVLLCRGGQVMYCLEVCHSPEEAERMIAHLTKPWK